MTTTQIEKALGSMLIRHRSEIFGNSGDHPYWKWGRWHVCFWSAGVLYPKGFPLGEQPLRLATQLSRCCLVNGLPLRWRRNGHGCVSNHQPHHCLLNRLFGRRSKKTSKLRVTSLCAGNLLGTGEFPAQMASNAENVPIWWRHHALTNLKQVVCIEAQIPYTTQHLPKHDFIA